MNLSAFMAPNAVVVENVKYIASPRFLSDQIDEKTQKPIPEAWEIKALTGTADEELRKSCTKRVPVPGKRNQFQKETDMDMYLGKLAVACTVYPDLHDKELQDSYNNPVKGIIIMGAEALLKVMLTPGEYSDYLNKVSEVNGFEKPFEDLVDEAKN